MALTAHTFLGRCAPCRNPYPELSRVLLHLIFSTKHREPLISDQIRPRLHAYMVGNSQLPQHLQLAQQFAALLKQLTK